jgi:hypothetical protein
VSWPIRGVVDFRLRRHQTDSRRRKGVARILPHPVMSLSRLAARATGRDRACVLHGCSSRPCANECSTVNHLNLKFFKTSVAPALPHGLLVRNRIPFDCFRLSRSRSCQPAMSLDDLNLKSHGPQGQGERSGELQVEYSAVDLPVLQKRRSMRTCISSESSESQLMLMGAPQIMLVGQEHG